MIMMVFGLYEKTIDAISNYFDDVWENTKFLFILGSGVIISIILMSNLIMTLLLNFYFLVVCFFSGLILGGIPTIYKKVESTLTKQNLVIFLTCLLFVFPLSLIDNNKQLSLNQNYHFLLLYVIGLIEAATMIIPGISGTAILIILGFYHILLELFSLLGNLKLILINIQFFTPFLLGLISGGLIWIKLMNYLLINYKIKTYWGILGLIVSSVLLMGSELLNKYSCGYELFLGIFLLIFGYILSIILDKKLKR